MPYIHKLGRIGSDYGEWEACDKDHGDGNMLLRKWIEGPADNGDVMSRALSKEQRLVCDTAIELFCMLAGGANWREEALA